MSAYGTEIALIPAGESLSAGSPLTGGPLLAVLMPAAFTGSIITFQVSTDAGLTYSNLYVGGNEFVEPVGPNQYVTFGAQIFAGINAIKIRSGTADNPAVQAQDAPIQIIGALAAAMPNPCRTIDAECTGCVGTFSAYWTTDSDPATFDLTFILGEDETITSIIEFDVAPEGPAGVTDPDPSARQIGSPTIIGAAVSQRFGNWQPDILQIIYRASLICGTSYGNAKSIYAWVVVNRPPSLS